MNTLENFNAVIDYVENHITDELDINHLASIACCSVYNFQRTFSHAANMSVIDYIRKRRLTLAGKELKQSEIKVIDIAMKYGYDSPISFARAFKVFHGINPSEARNSDIALKTFSRMAFQIYLKEVNDVKIVEKGEMFISGFLVEPDGGNLWRKYEETTAVHEGPELVDWSAHEVKFFTNEGERIFIGCRQINNITVPHYEMLHIPAATWVVFEIDHKLDFGSQFAKVFEWLNNNENKYKRMTWNANGRVSESLFEINHYDHNGKFGKDRIMELWIPLV